MPRLARRLRRRMSELGMSQTELATKCCLISADLFDDCEHPNITRERIARILMHCKAEPGRSAARVITYRELRVLATVLQVSPEWLAGHDESRDPVMWDPLADVHRVEQILHLINEHETAASELLIWSEYLISSLETTEFMHMHHEAMFSELDALGANADKRKIVQIYDTIGNARRKRLLDGNRKHRKLIQLIFSSDLERMAQGKDEYAGIPKKIRRDCFENVTSLTSRPSLGVEMVVVSDQHAGRSKRAFRDYDSVGVFDESLVMWRYHSGRIAWSKSTEHTRLWRRKLNNLRQIGLSGSLTSILARLSSRSK